MRDVTGGDSADGDDIGGNLVRCRTESNRSIIVTVTFPTPDAAFKAHAF